MPLKTIPIIGWITRFLVFGALIFVAVAIAGGLYNARPKPEIADTAGQVPTVDVITLQAVEVNREWSGFGTARALDSADVPARVTAVVIDIPENVLDGAPVHEGQLLVQLDDSDFRNQVEIAAQNIADIDAQLSQLALDADILDRQLILARENLDIARRDLDRVNDAIGRGAAQQRELDQAEQSVNAAQREILSIQQSIDQIQPRRGSLQARRLAQSAQRSTALLNVDRCSIQSPIDGIIQDIDVEIGESLMPGQRVARVVDLSVIEIPVLIASQARQSVRLGSPVNVRSSATPPTTWEATVARIAPEDDQASRTMTIFVEVEQDPDDASSLAPGRFVAASVRSGAGEGRIVVPRRCVKDGRVRVIDEGQVELRSVVVAFSLERSLGQFGIPDSQWLVIDSGLQPGDQVVLDPNRLLPIGTRVIARPANERPGS